MATVQRKNKHDKPTNKNNNIVMKFCNRRKCVDPSSTEAWTVCPGDINRMAERIKNSETPRLDARDIFFAARRKIARRLNGCSPQTEKNRNAGEASSPRMGGCKMDDRSRITFVSYDFEFDDDDEYTYITIEDSELRNGIFDSRSQFTFETVFTDDYLDFDANSSTLPPPDYQSILWDVPPLHLSIHPDSSACSKTDHQSRVSPTGVYEWEYLMEKHVPDHLYQQLRDVTCAQMNQNVKRHLDDQIGDFEIEMMVMQARLEESRKRLALLSTEMTKQQNRD